VRLVKLLYWTRHFVTSLSHHSFAISGGAAQLRRNPLLLHRHHMQNSHLAVPIAFDAVSCYKAFVLMEVTWIGHSGNVV
jgi:hypothetical protein